MSAGARWRQATGLLGRLSMYRLVLWGLAAVAAVAFVLSLFSLVVPGPVELLASAAVLAAVCVGADAAAHRILGRGTRTESSLITAGILLFVLRPSAEPAGLLGLTAAGLAAVASKYLLAWRGRHLFNPAAVGATVITLVSALLPLDSGVGASAWWVGSPFLLVPVLVFGVLVLVRTEKLAVAALFAAVALAVGLLRTGVQLAAVGLPFDPAAALLQLISASPIPFLAAFMLSEPLTLPPRRWQQLIVAAVVGVGVGWPLALGPITLGQERALLIGNLLGFLLAARGGLRLRLVGTRRVGQGVRELEFEASGVSSFLAGQYLELEVRHRGRDARGSRREFSIVSAPSDLPRLRIAYRDDASPRSSYKGALAEVEPGQVLRATGVWGDFVLPADATRPVLLVAGGIGITPIVAQLRELRALGQERDVVLVAVSGDDVPPFADELDALGARVLVCCREAVEGLPPAFEVLQGRLDEASLSAAVPDLADRDAFVSGPPALIAAIAPALSRARRVTTDAFAGY